MSVRRALALHLTPSALSAPARTWAFSRRFRQDNRHDEKEGRNAAQMATSQGAMPGVQTGVQAQAAGSRAVVLQREVQKPSVLEAQISGTGSHHPGH